MLPPTSSDFCDLLQCHIWDPCSVLVLGRIHPVLPWLFLCRFYCFVAIQMCAFQLWNGLDTSCICLITDIFFCSSSWAVSFLFFLFFVTYNTICCHQFSRVPVSKFFSSLLLIWAASMTACVLVWNLSVSMSAWQTFRHLLWY